MPHEILQCTKFTTLLLTGKINFYFLGGILFLNLVSSFAYFQMSGKMYGGHHINKYKNNIFQYVDEFKKSTDSVILDKLSCHVMAFSNKWHPHGRPRKFFKPNQQQQELNWSGTPPGPPGPATPPVRRARHPEQIEIKSSQIWFFGNSPKKLIS